MSIKIGTRIFAPRLFTTLATLALVALLLRLGVWQLHRADEKRLLYDAFAAGSDATMLITLSAAPPPRYQHAEASGRYDTSRQILIDNMVDASGGAGYFVITPFALSGGGWLLVNRGWVPMGASRAALPDVAVAGEERHVRGRADNMPSPGIRMGTPAPLAPPYPVVANFPSRDDIARLLHQSDWASTHLLLLDPEEPDGYVRRWSAPGFPPMRHIAYAVQWFALALTLLVIYAVTNLRRRAVSA